MHGGRLWEKIDDSEACLYKKCTGSIGKVNTETAAALSGEMLLLNRGRGQQVVHSLKSGPWFAKHIVSR